ncbi:hypothetical protein ES703_51059 [subsurface metagenome]
MSDKDRIDARIRGMSENLIDTLTSDEGLTTEFLIIGEFKPIVKSEQDAVFGYILGLALSNFATNYKLIYHRSPTRSETATFRNMLLERANIIMSKIQKFSNL